MALVIGIHYILPVLIDNATNVSAVGDWQTDYLPYRKPIGLRW